MRKYLTLITVAGLRRADLGRAREPIGEGEVIALPDGFARSLLDSGAIEPTDADETVELHWDQPVELIKSNDIEGLKAALEVYGIDFASGPDQTAMQIVPVGIAPTDVEALAQALEAAGALVVLQGEELAGKDRARLMKLFADEAAAPGLMDLVHTSQLLAELARRIGEGEIELGQLPEELMGLVAPAFPTATLEATEQEPVPVVEPAVVAEPPADVKPAKATKSARKSA